MGTENIKGDLPPRLQQRGPPAAAAIAPAVPAAAAAAAGVETPRDVRDMIPGLSQQQQQQQLLQQILVYVNCSSDRQRGPPPPSPLFWGGPTQPAGFRQKQKQEWLF